MSILLNKSIFFYLTIVHSFEPSINFIRYLISLSTKWVDYVEEPMKYQALRPQFFSMGRWGVVARWGWWWVGVGWWWGGWGGGGVGGGRGGRVGGGGVGVGVGGVWSGGGVVGGVIRLSF